MKALNAKKVANIGCAMMLKKSLVKRLSFTNLQKGIATQSFNSYRNVIKKQFK